MRKGRLGSLLEGGSELRGGVIFFETNTRKEKAMRFRRGRASGGGVGEGVCFSRT